MTPSITVSTSSAAKGSSKSSNNKVSLSFKSVSVINLWNSHNSFPSRITITGTILFQVVKETLDSNVTSSGDTSSGEISAAASNSISKHRREVLIRQPSYCKILDDLQGTEEKVLKQATAKMKGQHNVLEVICIYYYYEDLRQYYVIIRHCFFK